ncbi:ABC transporter substrate-binding protein [Frankia tisae]|uniref:ABC transporter substrate-binding protein n=1 Tax=Frankia tisae TaxID=2950104 RepID=UPI0021C0E49C|nr:ABC transporter substrate-binding protein [Frankia tisae]
MSVPARFTARAGRRLAALTSVVVLGATLAACSSSSGSTENGSTGHSGDQSNVTLTFGFQTADYPALLKASGLFNNLPYKLDTPVISGPAAQISALYSKATDFGLVGENTAAFEAANADTDLSKSEPKIYTIAGYSAPGNPHPSPALYVRTSANINSIQDLRGHSIAYNFGGNIYAGYVKILAQAGLTLNDIKPVRLPDNQSAAAAFVAGQVDAVVSGYTSVAKVVDSGQAKLLIDNESLGIRGGAGFITRPDVLTEQAKLAAAKDFFGRFSTFYSVWYPNHEAEVTKIYESVLKQTPAIAKINFETQKPGKLYQIGDPQFIKDQQAIVDAAFKANGVKHDYDISKVFNPIFDAVAVPS